MAAVWGFPIGWPTLAVAMLLTIATFNLYRNGGVTFMEDFPVLVAWLIFCGVVALRILARLLLMIVPRWRGIIRGRWMDYRAVAVILLVLLNRHGVQQRWPIRVGFWLSRGEMNRYAASVRSSTPWTGNVGLYQVQKLQQLPGGGFRMEIGNVGFIDPDAIGFEYAPGGVPSNGTAIDLGGGWYRW
jgi:hypothetical protein